MNKSLSSPIKIAISYGLNGGPLNSRKFRRLASASGFEVTTLDQADILIAHSAGCWLAPEGIEPKLVIYVSMPINTGSKLRIFEQATLKGHHSGNHMHALKTNFLGIFYFTFQPAKNIRILTHPRIGKPTIYKQAEALFISNHYDPWPNSDNLIGFTEEHKAWNFLSLPGSHDTIWEKPELVIEVMEVYADRLLAETRTR